MPLLIPVLSFHSILPFHYRRLTRTKDTHFHIWLSDMVLSLSMHRACNKSARTFYIFSCCFHLFCIPDIP